MRPDPRLLTILVGPDAQAGEGATAHIVATLSQDAPAGVRLPDRPGCAVLPEVGMRAAEGFRDIGGVRLRVGGRISAEYGDAR